MQLVIPPSSVAPVGLSAMKQVARAASGGLVETHRALLETVQRVVLRTDLDVDALPDVDARTLSEHVRDPAVARQLVRGLIVMSLATGPATPEQMALVGGFASALGVDEPAVGAITHLAHEHKLRFLLDLHRRSNLLAPEFASGPGLLGI